MDSEILIIGGGIAGSTAAIHLSRLGHSVILIEKEAGPHHKICGEFISHEALLYLNEIGINLKELGAVEYKYFRLHSGFFHSCVPLTTSSFGISRFLLDEALINKAKECGANVQRGVKVTDIQKESLSSDTYNVYTSKSTFKAKTIFFATGKHEIKHLHHRTGKDNSAVAFKMYFKLTDKKIHSLSNYIDLYVFRGGYAGLSLIENRDVNLCFILDKNLCKQLKGDFWKILLYLKQKNPGLRDYLENAEPKWDYPLIKANAPLGYLYEPSVNNTEKQKSNGIYYIGDQFAVIPPLTGLGMNISLLTARKAAYSYHDNKTNSLNKYNRDIYFTLKPKITLAYRIHKLFKYPALTSFCLLFLKYVPSFLGWLYNRTRIK